MTTVPDSALLHAIYWLVNTPGLGGVAVAGIIGACAGGFSMALLWIVRGGRAPETSTYTHPTSTLLHHE